MPLGMKTVNCYLLSTKNGFILIDSGSPNARKELTEQLKQAGCTPGLLELVILTHGDFDHMGNAAFLQRTFKTRLAMHPEDAEMAVNGDMFRGRNKPNFIIRTLVPLLIGFRKTDRYNPDILLEDGYSLAQFGVDASIVSIPGHSKGSIGIFTSNGELFCGDLFENTNQPALNTLMNDVAAGNASAAMLKTLPIHTVFPGHGPSFSFDQM